MFAEVEVSGDLIDPEFWEQCLQFLVLVVISLAVVGLGPPFVWWASRRGQKDPVMPSVPETPAGGADAPSKKAPAIPVFQGPGQVARRPRTAPAARKEEADGQPAPGAQQQRGERRKHVRRKGQPTQVVVADAQGQGAPITCWVVNRSRGGLGIVVDRPFQAGTALTVRPANTPEDVDWIPIEVRNCRKKANRWYIGCQFPRELPWNVILMFG
jgi:hypothetical protein